MGTIHRITNPTTIKGGTIMNRLVIISVIILGFFLSSCKTQKSAVGVNNDDVYYQATTCSRLFTTRHTPAQTVTSPDNTKTVPPPSATLNEDLSDYPYSSRIKRFNSSDTTAGYYDETYTNPANYDTTYIVSSSPNVNISFGAGFGSYGYGTSFGFGIGWGCDPYYGYGYPYYGYGYPYYGWGSPWYYNPWYYDPWYYGYPYYYPGYAYGGYWNGYYDGYWDGYYGYPYGGYGNEYPYGGYYYGRRSVLGTGGSGTPNPRVAGSVNPQAEPNSRTVTTTGMGDNVNNLTSERTANGFYTKTAGTDNGAAARSTVTTASASASTRTATPPATQQKYRYTRPSGEKQQPYQRQATAQQQTRQATTQQQTQAGYHPTADYQAGSAQAYTALAPLCKT